MSFSSLHCHSEPKCCWGFFNLIFLFKGLLEEDLAFVVTQCDAAGNPQVPIDLFLPPHPLPPPP